MQNYTNIHKYGMTITFTLIFHKLLNVFIILVKEFAVYHFFLKNRSLFFDNAKLFLKDNR